MNKDYLYPELLKKYFNYWNNTKPSVTNVHITKNQKDNDKNLLLLKRAFLKWLDQLIRVSSYYSLVEYMTIKKIEKFPKKVL